MIRALAIIAVLLAAHTAVAQYISVPTNPVGVVVGQELNFPCQYCSALVSYGGGIFGRTTTIMDLHVISSAADTGFPRALVLRIESECASCEPAALQISAKGLTANAAPFAANMGCDGFGRCTVLEANMGAALGGYVFDVVPTRMADGSPSLIDSVLNIEGFGYDPGVAQIGSIMDVKINPTVAITVIPSDQGPVTVMETSDGRMREVWSKDDYDNWRRQVIIDGVAQP